MTDRTHDRVGLRFKTSPFSFWVAIHRAFASGLDNHLTECLRKRKPGSQRTPTIAWVSSPRNSIGQLPRGSPGFDGVNRGSSPRLNHNFLTIISREYAFRQNIQLKGTRRDYNVCSKT